MQIESKIRRKNGTKALLDDTEYHFKPAKEGGPHVANVTDQAHIARFLSITEGYCVADGDPALQAEPDEGPALGAGDQPPADDSASEQEQDEEAGAGKDEGNEDAKEEGDEKPAEKKAPAKTGTPRKRGRKSAADQGDS